VALAARVRARYPQMVTFVSAAQAYDSTMLLAAAIKQAGSTDGEKIAAALEGEHKDKPFILVARELTLLGFYTSEVGITENMEYVPVPTVYHGCVPLSEMKKHVYWE